MQLGIIGIPDLGYDSVVKDLFCLNQSQAAYCSDIKSLSRI